LKELLLITLSIVSAVVVATLINEPEALGLMLTTMVAVALAPAARVLNVHVTSGLPVHDPPVATADTRVVPVGISSLIWTLVAAVVVLKLVTVSV
jgi:hypothetical protein